jgi:hypothetical protein
MARTPPKSAETDEPGLPDREPLIDSDQLAKWLDVPRGTLDQWASRGGGPAFVKVGKHRKYDPADVRAWIQSKRRTSHGDAA